MSRCRSCQAPIGWAKTEAGKNIPVDITPTTEGNLVFIDGTARPGATVRYITPSERGVRYTSHFATCPCADQHRGPRSPRGG